MVHEKKIKVVLDSDVIIHFIKGDCLNLLPRILPVYEFIILDIVYERELSKSHRIIIQNMVHILKTISIEIWNPINEERKEFLSLQKDHGLGESASMAYCKYRKNILASSNLKDIVEYCEVNKITCFTTMDFLYQAMVSKVMTEEECNSFIKKVKLRNSKLPVSSMREFRPRLIL